MKSTRKVQDTLLLRHSFSLKFINEILREKKIACGKAKYSYVGIDLGSFLRALDALLFWRACVVHHSRSDFASRITRILPQYKPT
jgi:hypothetical protein